MHSIAHSTSRNCTLAPSPIAPLQTSNYRNLQRQITENTQIKLQLHNTLHSPSTNTETTQQRNNLHSELPEHAHLKHQKQIDVQFERPKFVVSAPLLESDNQVFQLPTPYDNLTQQCNSQRLLLNSPCMENQESTQQFAKDKLPQISLPSQNVHTENMQLPDADILQNLPIRGNIEYLNPQRESTTESRNKIIQSQHDCSALSKQENELQVKQHQLILFENQRATENQKQIQQKIELHSHLNQNQIHLDETVIQNSQQIMHQQPVTDSSDITLLNLNDYQNEIQKFQHKLRPNVEYNNIQNPRFSDQSRHPKEKRQHLDSTSFIQTPPHCAYSKIQRQKLNSIDQHSQQKDELQYLSSCQQQHEGKLLFQQANGQNTSKTNFLQESFEIDEKKTQTNRQKFMNSTFSQYPSMKQYPEQPQQQQQQQQPQTNTSKSDNNPKLSVLLSDEIEHFFGSDIQMMGRKSESKNILDSQTISNNSSTNLSRAQLKEMYQTQPTVRKQLIIRNMILQEENYHHEQQLQLRHHLLRRRNKLRGKLLSSQFIENTSIRNIGTSSGGTDSTDDQLTGTVTDCQPNQLYREMRDAIANNDMTDNSLHDGSPTHLAAASFIGSNLWQKTIPLNSDHKVSMDCTDMPEFLYENDLPLFDQSIKTNISVDSQTSDCFRNFESNGTAIQDHVESSQSIDIAFPVCPSSQQSSSLVTKLPGCSSKFALPLLPELQPNTLPMNEKGNSDEKVVIKSAEIFCDQMENNFSKLANDMPDLEGQFPRTIFHQTNKLLGDTDNEKVPSVIQNRTVTNSLLEKEEFMVMPESPSCQNLVCRVQPIVRGRGDFSELDFPNNGAENSIVNKSDENKNTGTSRPTFDASTNEYIESRGEQEINTNPKKNMKIINKYFNEDNLSIGEKIIRNRKNKIVTKRESSASTTNVCEDNSRCVFTSDSTSSISNCSDDIASPVGEGLESTDGQDFNPKMRCFSIDELKPLPIIKKGRKLYVPSDKKDEKYWARRQKNNVAAKRSRDARRIKENQIALRATFLEETLRTSVPEQPSLAKELEDARNTIKYLKKRLSVYEHIQTDLRT